MKRIDPLKNNHSSSRGIYITIFLVSGAGLMLEVSLTRLFSIYLFYHFAFMVISIAMLGIGSAGTVLSVFPALRDIKNMSIYAMLSGIAVFIGYIVSNQIPFDPVKISWDRMQILYVALYCLVLSIPFFFIGMLIASAFYSLSERSGRIYGSDLIGAGTGALAVIFLLNLTGPEYAVLTASALCLLASFISGTKRTRYFVTLLLAVNIITAVFHPDFINVRLSPYKSFSLALKYPGAEHLKTFYNSFSRIDTLKSPAVRYAPGLSLTFLDPLPDQIGLSIDAGEVNAVTRHGNKETLRFLEFLPSALAYEIKMRKDVKNSGNNLTKNPPSPPFDKGGMGGFLKSGFYASGGADPLRREARGDQGQRGINVLVLEPKGGLQTLMAHYYKDKEVYPVRKALNLSNGVHSIESNPLVLKVIREELGEFSGGIYDQNTWSGLGRSLLKSSQFTSLKPQFHPVRKKAPQGFSNGVFDIIDIPMTGTSVTGSFGISEDYRFTVEAFSEYLQALKKDGIMSISMYIIPPPRTELRVMATVIAALEQKGVEEPIKHIAAIRSWDSITLTVKNSPFVQTEIRRIKKFAKSKRFDLMFYPGMAEKEAGIYIKTFSNEYFKAFQKLLDPAARPAFINDYIFDVSPVYDENPFFHYYLKLSNIKEIYEVMGRKWQYFIEEGYLLLAVFIIVLLLSIFMIMLPVAVKTIRKIPKIQFEQLERFERFKPSLTFPTLLYFAMLGTGFMFVEITLIQKSILVLENPAYAFATVLTSVLIGSGAGGLLSSGFTNTKIRYCLLGLCGLITVYSFALPFLLNFVIAYPLIVKVPMIFAVLIPAGFLMGIPFPAGIRLLGLGSKPLIPWAWAVNGFMSVLAPILAVMIAMSFGFRTVLLLGTAAYITAFLSLKKL